MGGDVRVHALVSVVLRSVFLWKGRGMGCIYYLPQYYSFVPGFRCPHEYNFKCSKCGVLPLLNLNNVADVAYPWHTRGIPVAHVMLTWHL